MNDWLRPLTWFENANGTLPAIQGGPFPDDALALCTSGYGPRTPLTLPDGSQTGAYHYGTDWWAAEWETNPPAVLSLVDGICEFAEADNYAVGNWVRVRDLGGRFAVDYYHLRDAPTVKIGDSIWMGQPLGVVGATGWSTGVHLHLQIIDGLSAVDPLPFLRDAPRIGVAAVEVDVASVEKKVNTEAVGLIYDLLRSAAAVAGQVDGQYIGVLPGAPAGYRDVVTRVKE